MTLDVKTIPGYVIVTCGDDTRVIAGVLLPPPAEVGDWRPTVVPTKDLPSTGYGWPQIGKPGGGISVLNVHLALPGETVKLENVRLSDAFNSLVKCREFASFVEAAPGNFALSASIPDKGLGQKAANTIGELSNSVIVGSWKREL
jgi:hypothetical protein